MSMERRRETKLFHTPAHLGERPRADSAPGMAPLRSSACPILSPVKDHIEIGEETKREPTLHRGCAHATKQRAGKRTHAKNEPEEAQQYPHTYSRHLLGAHLRICTCLPIAKGKSAAAAPHAHSHVWIAHLHVCTCLPIAKGKSAAAVPHARSHVYLFQLALLPIQHGIGAVQNLHVAAEVVAQPWPLNDKRVSLCKGGNAEEM